jgi:hypothetical protein
MTAVGTARDGPGYGARLGAALLLAALTAAIAGCGGKSTGKADPVVVKQYADRGYAPDRHYETVATQDTWAVGLDIVDVSLLVPSPPGSYPLVVYLPGLGESPEAGASWRQTWARAGYAVLSVQPAKYGTAVWASKRARYGEFYAIAKEAFSAPSLATRTQLLGDTLAEAARRQKDARMPDFARVDWSRIAIAGFDLGAQTAMVAAGGSFRGVEPLKLPDGVKCVVALSPYADFSGMGTESNFQPIRLSVLSVTSPFDTDPYGLVTSAAVRRAPFQYMPPEKKYLLLLSGAPHSALAGTPLSVPDGKEGKGPQAQEEDASIVGDQTADPDEGRPGKKRRRLDSSGSRGEQAAQRAKEQTQVQAVTTAYLDAIVKNDAVAAEWLTRNAKRWLGESAELMSK